MTLLQINKFGELHNGKNIIFCKTEKLAADFKKISRISNEVILISGNSDDPIDQNILSKLPDNVKYIFCQNSSSKHPKVKTIPIGLENTFENKRKGHGIGWQHAVLKLELLSSIYNSTAQTSPGELIYSNFNIETNPQHRKKIRDISRDSDFINWEEPTLEYRSFLSNVLRHEAVLCPAGNGLDTHRLYEILYCKRIPITVKTGDFFIYEDLYQHLPIVILDHEDQLMDQSYMINKINKVKRANFDKNMLDFNYWKGLILDKVPPVKIEQSLFGKLFNKRPF